MLIKQEIQRKSGYAIQVDEEHLRVQLDTIQSELNAPTQFKVRLCLSHNSNKCMLPEVLIVFHSLSRIIQLEIRIKWLHWMFKIVLLYLQDLDFD